MSVQVSTRIDEETKRQFDRVCKHIGISTSNALNMFIRGVINYNGIPFDAIAPKEKELPVVAKSKTSTAARPPFKYGSMSGSVWMADDFDAPLDDFADYM